MLNNSAKLVTYVHLTSLLPWKLVVKSKFVLYLHILLHPRALLVWSCSWDTAPLWVVRVSVRRTHWGLGSGAGLGPGSETIIRLVCYNRLKKWTKNRQNIYRICVPLKHCSTSTRNRIGLLIIVWRCTTFELGHALQLINKFLNIVPVWYNLISGGN